MTAIDPLLKLKTALGGHDVGSDSEPVTSRLGQFGGMNSTLSAAALEVAGQLSDRQISRTLLLGTVRLVEGAMVLVLGTATLWHTRGDFGGFGGFNTLTILACAMLAVLYIQAFEGYSTSGMRSFFQQFGRVIASWTMALATLVVVAVITGRGSAVGDPWMTEWFATGVMGFGLFRFVLSRKVRAWARDGRLERRAVIVGGGKAAEDLIRSIELQPDNDIRICGIFDDRGGDRSPDIVAGYPKLGNIAELVEFGRLSRLDMLLVTVPISAEDRILQLMRKLWVLPVDIRLSAHSNKLKFRPRTYSYVGKVPLINVMDKPLADWDAVAKRAFDIVFSLGALVVLAPVMVGAAIAIKLDSPGPVFFRQRRYGFNNELVNVWKFRSMRVETADANASKLVSKGDPRVTRVGAFIRKTSIDELPQLFNVLEGSLSLVGPRPHALSAKADNQLYEKVVDGYFARHKVKPGVTGWAQIHGWRGETDTQDKIQKRVEHDLYYIENWSIWLDLYVLFATPFKLFNSDNAY